MAATIINNEVCPFDVVPFVVVWQHLYVRALKKFSNIYYTPSGKKRNIAMNEFINVEKAIWMLAHAYYFSLQPFSARLAIRAYSTLTRQLEAVIIEEFTAQALSLRTDQWQMHEAKYLLPTKVTYCHTEYHNGQASYFNMKVLVLRDIGHIHFFSTILLT